MSEFRRRLMAQVASDPNALPDGCVRCEYLESYLDNSDSNGQYIDTGRVVKDTDIIELKFAIRSDNSGKSFFGWRWFGVYSDGNHCYLIADPTYFRLGYGNNANLTNFPFVIDSVNSLYINPNTGKVLVNGKEDKTSRNFSLPYSNGTSVYNPYLFTTNNIGTPYSGCKARIYDYLVKDKEGNEVQHLIPILDQDGIPCMYDLVGKRFHYNARTNKQDNFRYKIAE